MLAIPPCPSLVRKLSLAPLEGDVYYLVLRPLLDFYFSSCGVCSMPLRWKNALLIMIIIVLALWLKRTKKQEKCVVECCTDSTRDVVFLLESTNLGDGPFYSSHRQMGIKQPATQSRCLMTEISSVITDCHYKSFV